MIKRITKVINLNGSKALELRMTNQEYSVLKLSLKKYNNHYGNCLLKRLEKSEL